MSSRSKQQSSKPRPVMSGPRGGKFSLLFDPATKQYKKVYKRSTKVAANQPQPTAITQPPPPVQDAQTQIE